MRDEDLAPFAVADGLLAKMTTDTTWLLTEVEQDHLMDRARENLARATGETIEVATAKMGQALDEGEFTIQAGNEFACVTIYGRLLYVIGRHELRGVCHPERN